jgi:hypothetical protein
MLEEIRTVSRHRHGAQLKQHTPDFESDAEHEHQQRGPDNHRQPELHGILRKLEHSASLHAPQTHISFRAIFVGAGGGNEVCGFSISFRGRAEASVAGGDGWRGAHLCGRACKERGHWVVSSALPRRIIGFLSIITRCHRVWARNNPKVACRNRTNLSVRSLSHLPSLLFRNGAATAENRHPRFSPPDFLDIIERDSVCAWPWLCRGPPIDDSCTLSPTIPTRTAQRGRLWVPRRSNFLGVINAASPLATPGLPPALFMATFRHRFQIVKKLTSFPWHTGNA